MVTGPVLTGLVLTSLALPAAAQTHSGVVTDGSTGLPLPGAVVVVNRSTRAITDGSGAFAVTGPAGATSELVFATFPGRVTGVVSLPLGSTTTGLALAVSAYPSFTAGFTPERPAQCATCHATYMRGWGSRGGFSDSAHSTSASNPRVLDIWRGTASGRTDAALCSAVSGELVTITDAGGDTTSRCYVGVGLLPDMNPLCGHAGQPRCDDHAAAVRPTNFSDCAGCHTPGAAIADPYELDLDVAEEDPDGGSVTCAGCHRIAEVGDPNAPGVLVGATVIRGGPTGTPLGLGPLDDAGATGMLSGHAPLFTESLMCAPCHQDTYQADGMNPRWTAFGGVPSEQTYAEWLESPYASGPREATCQSCHMRSLDTLGIEPSLPEIATEGGVRGPSVMHAHDFPALTDPGSHAAALDLTVTARLEGSSVVVDAAITNVAVGHGFPSGVTSRNALIVVTAELPDGRLIEIGGDVLPLYAGSYDNGSVASVAGSTLTLDHAVDASAIGREIRLFNDTVTPRPHQSFGLLRTLPLGERGTNVREALGRFTVTAVRGNEVDVDSGGTSLTGLSGARFAIGDDERLAGVAGLGLAKVNVAAGDVPNVPFWRAVDLISDNRLAPDETQSSEHRFALPAGATGNVTVRARLLYRGAFVDLAVQRGWSGNEHLALEEETLLELPRIDGGVGDSGVPRDAGAPTPSSSCGCSVTSEAVMPGWLFGSLMVALALRARRRALARGSDRA